MPICISGFQRQRPGSGLQGKGTDSFRDSYRVYPDAAAVLAVCLYKGYKNYLLSNNYPELEEVLARLQLRQFFPDVSSPARLA